jgi:hypothetical protein
MLPPSLDIAALDAVPGFRHWFRYRLHDGDFHPLRTDAGADARLLGYYAAKPRYGRLDARGRVDRGAGFDGGIVALFVPSPARSWKRARLVHARMPRDRIIGTDGRRNWPAIRRAAETAIRRAMQRAAR